MTDLLRDILKDDNAGSLGSLAVFASGAPATGNSPAGSGSDGNHNSGVTSGPAGGARTASAARSSSGKGTQTSSAPDLRISDGTRRPRDAKPDVYRDRVAELGDSSAPTFDVPGASWKHVAASESMHGSSGDNPGTNGGSGGGRDGGDNHALEPLNDDLVGQLLNGLGNRLHDAEGWESDFQNEVNGGAGSERDSGHLAEFGNRPNNDPKAEDHSPFNTPLATEPVSGPVSSVPAPGSLGLLSLGLGAIILERKFRPTR